jgi:hypothetical protein
MEVKCVHTMSRRKITHDLIQRSPALEFSCVVKVSGFGDRKLSWFFDLLVC